MRDEGELAVRDERSHVDAGDSPQCVSSCSRELIRRIFASDSNENDAYIQLYSLQSSSVAPPFRVLDDLIVVWLSI